MDGGGKEQAVSTPLDSFCIKTTVKTSALFIALLAAAAALARPVFDFGVVVIANQEAAHDAQVSHNAEAASQAAAAEAAAGIDIAASITAASSSAAAVAATATVSALDPVPARTFGLTPEQLGELSGLRAKLQIDTQFGDDGAIEQDTLDINALESRNDVFKI
ncbi:hypothetical protein B0H19DRAFT_1256363 [Mycena capillaripes]|nr:hypothetical protein B0H19DRAFT_1256363 [Mycena capillaripes]